MKCYKINVNYNLNYIKPKFCAKPDITKPAIKSVKKETKGLYALFTADFCTVLALKQKLVEKVQKHKELQDFETIKDAIIDYAKKFCKELGKPDMPIYAGPNRHKVDLSSTKLVEHKVMPIGISKDEIYLDFLTAGIELNNNKTFDICLYKLA